MSKHTPGPWQIVEGQPWDKRGGHYWFVRGYDEREEMVNVCALPEGCEANARLIAAAPDLLEALSLLVDHQNGCPLPKYESDWNRAMKLAYAAIAKAQGATP